MTTDREAWERTLLCALVFVLVLVLCSCQGTVLGDYASGPNEQRIAAIVMGQCKQIGVDATVVFASTSRKVDGEPYGQEGLVCVGMSAIARTNTVVVYPAVVDLPDERIRAYAQHECCHLALGHVWTPERTEEAEAEACVRERY